MKYIRTNDGIYEVYTKDLDLNDKTDRDIAGFRAQHCKGWNYPPLTPKDIVKIADTIKELCDEWICRDNNNIEYRPYRFYFLDDLYAFIKENKLFERYKVYGAIWTDKGLIYVAKMNDKGELELL